MMRLHDGHEENLDGCEFDAFTRWRRRLNWRPGVLAKVKRCLNKRVRKGGRRAAKEGGDA